MSLARPAPSAREDLVFDIRLWRRKSYKYDKYDKLPYDKYVKYDSFSP